MHTYATPQKKAENTSATPGKATTGNPLQKQANTNNPLQMKTHTADPSQAYEDLEKPWGGNAFQLKANEAAAPPPAQQPVKKNNTGLPDNLKSGVESLSGFNMDDVKVHYNSDKPTQLQALAYAQGTDIHVAPGQEQHLPHEAWHVAQQKQGRVQATVQMKGGVNVNDDKGLEGEADQMGAKAMQPAKKGSHLSQSMSFSQVAQKVDSPRTISKDEQLRWQKGKPQDAVIRSLPKNKDSENKDSDPVWVKLGEEAGKAKAASDFITYHAQNHNKTNDWKISTPSIRYGTPEDKTALTDRGGLIFKRKIERSKNTTNSPDRGDEVNYTDENLRDSIKDTGFDRFAVASHAPGDEALVENDTRLAYHQFEKDLASQPSNSEGQHPDTMQSYAKTMGYVQLMDIVMGNNDRGLGAFNAENYKIEASRKKVHLMDNFQKGKLQPPNTEKGEVYEPVVRGSNINELIQNNNSDELKTFMSEHLNDDEMNPAYGSLSKNEQFIDHYVKGLLNAKSNLPQTYDQLKAMKNDPKNNNEDYKKAMRSMRENIRRIATPGSLPGKKATPLSSTSSQVTTQPVTTMPPISSINQQTMPSWQPSVRSGINSSNLTLATTRKAPPIISTPVITENTAQQSLVTSQQSEIGESSSSGSNPEAISDSLAINNLESTLQSQPSIGMEDGISSTPSQHINTNDSSNILTSVRRDRMPLNNELRSFRQQMRNPKISSPETINELFSINNDDSEPSIKNGKEEE